MRLVVWLAASVLMSCAVTHGASEQVAAAEPDRVVVQHLLIGFKRSVAGKRIDRTKAEAEVLAAKLLGRARAGEDFDAMVREYTDDIPPGIYTLTNRKAPRVGGGRTREQMVPGFGDLAFTLAVGEVGLLEHHYRLSPYGWHVMRRLE